MNSFKLLRYALFWDAMQRVVVIPYRRFGTTYRVPSFNSWPLKIGLISCPETLVRNYHYTLCMIPEDCRYHLLCGRSLKALLNCFSLKKQDPKTASLYHISLHKIHLLLSIPCTFNGSVRIFGSSHMDILHVDLIAKMKFYFVVATDFCQKCFIFYGMYITFMHIWNMSPCCLVLCVNIFAVTKYGEQGSFKEFSTHLATVHRTCG
jgi:hypothetical protein